MTKHPIIVDIGGNSEKRFGYDFQAQEIYEKNNKNLQSIASKAAGSGGVSATVLYGALYHFCNKIPSLDWLIVSTISSFILMFVLVKLGVFWVEHFENFKKFVKIQFSDFKDLQTLKDVSVTMSIITLSLITVIALACAPALANAYLVTSDMTLWMIYILMVFLGNICIYTCWYTFRGKKLRKLALEQLEKNEGKKEIENGN